MHTTAVAAEIVGLPVAFSATFIQFALPAAVTELLAAYVPWVPSSTVGVLLGVTVASSSAWAG